MADDSPATGSSNPPGKTPTPSDAATPPQVPPAPAPNPGPSTPQTSSPLQSAADRLYGGNVVADTPPQVATPPPTATPIEPALSISDEAEMRNLRELGIAERPETPRAAPERPDVFGSLEKSAVSEGATPVVRTYAADMSEEIRKRGETLSTIVGAEQRKAETAPVRETPKENRRSLLLIIGAAVLLLLGIGVIVAVVFLTMPKPAPAPGAVALVTTNASVPLPHDSAKSLPDELSSVRENAQMKLGELEDVPVTTGGTPMTAQDILSALHAPDLLARNATAVTIGFHAFNRTQPFILIHVSAYDLAFQAMLSWEPTMAEDLNGFFTPTAPGSLGTPPARLTFTDKVSQNVDTRVSSPDWPILYAFPQKDLLLITTNESTLKEILTRLASGG